MSSEYDRRPSSRYLEDGYGQPRYDDSRSRRDGYEREAPYDTVYRRSFEPLPDDQKSSRPGSRRKDKLRDKLHHESYADDAAYYKEQRQVARPRDDYEDSYRPRSRRSKGYDDYDDRETRQRGSGEYDEERKQLDGLVGKEKKDIAATVLGALGGAFLGHEASHGKPYGTLGGAVLGGLSANAIEHQHLKREDKRNERQRYQYDDRDDD